jgi:hypothetical protein
MPELSRFFGITIRMFVVRTFEIVVVDVLRGEFDHGPAQTIDFEPVLAGELLGPLRDPTLFRQVGLVPGLHTLVWPTSQTTASSSD